MAGRSAQQAFDEALDHHRAGRLDAAEALYCEILSSHPNQPQALHHLGLIAHERGDFENAERLLRAALAAKPDFCEALCHLAALLAAAPASDPASLFDLGLALHHHGLLPEAAATYQATLRADPAHPHALNNLGVILSELGDQHGAAHAFQHALSVRPQFAEAANNLGAALRELGQLSTAAAACQQALAWRPNYPEALNNLANTLAHQGDAASADTFFQRAMELAPDFAIAHSNRLYCAHYRDHDPAALAAAHHEWARIHAEPLTPAAPRHPNPPDPERRLRVGYVSADFHHHPVGRFLLPLLDNHDPEVVEVFCYADLAREDVLTNRLRARSHHWRSIAQLTDEQVSALIGHDQIDILVDLAGHTANNRLLVFARKPAPVQVTFLGYPNTTGLSAIDFRLTDAWADPPGMTETLHSETLLRVDGCAWCHDPAELPTLAARPARPLTYGSFNLLAKVSDSTIILWARVLAATPDSRLILKAKALTDPALQEATRSRFAAAGVDPARLDLRGSLPHYADHLAVYQEIDIALDPFPYHGTTTTCEALAMGVPVVTMAGASHVSRVGASLLHHVGLDELIATTADEYLQIAQALGNDPARLADLHHNLRARMANSTLGDSKRYAREIESAYRRAWRHWCARH